MINNCDDDDDDCEGYTNDDIDHHVGRDYFDGGLTFCIWFVVVVVAAAAAAAAAILFILWYFLIGYCAVNPAS